MNMNRPKDKENLGIKCYINEELNDNIIEDNSYFEGKLMITQIVSNMN